MEYPGATNQSRPRRKGLVTRLLLAAVSMFLAFVALEVVIWMLREVFQYSFAQVMFEPVYLERQKALASHLPALAIIPWALQYFSVMPLHVITGLLMAWKTPLVVIWGIMVFIGNGSDESRSAATPS